VGTADCRCSGMDATASPNAKGKTWGGQNTASRYVSPTRYGFEKEKGELGYLKSVLKDWRWVQRCCLVSCLCFFKALPHMALMPLRPSSMRGSAPSFGVAGPHGPRAQPMQARQRRDGGLCVRRSQAVGVSESISLCQHRPECNNHYVRPSITILWTTG
jgi:hypothetical protein